MFASPEHEARGIFTDTFKLWCVKLKDLRVEDFATGTLAMEQQAEEIYRRGDEKGRREMWPPSFAEFRALCFPPADYDRQAHKPFERLLALEDHAAREKRYSQGVKHTSALLAMLDDKPEPKPLTQAEIADNERLERLK
jgi:hypothetical protein